MVGLICTAWLATAGLYSAARAQDDWSITRPKKPAPSRPGPRAPSQPGPRAPSQLGPRAPRPAGADGATDAGRTDVRPGELLERTYRAFVASPEDGFALRRLRELWLLRDGALDTLLVRLREDARAAPSAATPALAVAHVLVLLEQRAEALTTLAPHLGDMRALFLHARLLREMGRRPEAEQAYVTASRGPIGATERRAALRALAELALDAGDLELARTRYAALGRAGGDRGDLAGEYPRALAARGLHAAAAQAFLSAANATRGDLRAAVPLLREAARAQLAAGDAAAATATLERAMAQASPTGGERAALYDLCIDAARASDGLRALAERLSHDVKGGLDAAARAAKLWDELGEETRAVESYRSLLRRAPRDLDARRALSQLLLRAGRLDEVVVEQRELVRLAPDEPAFVVGLAELLKQVGRAEEADRILRDASQRAPQSVPLHRALSELYARWGDPTRAEVELSLLARLDPDDPVHVVALGSERFERGDKAGALSTWKRLLERAGRDPVEGHTALAAVLADHDWLDLAIEHAQKAAALAPTGLEAQRMLASFYERAGRFPEAEVAWQTTLKLAAADAATKREARQHLVGIWARVGTLRRHQVALDERLGREPRDLEAARLLAEVHAHETGPQAMRAEQRVLEKIVAQEPSDLESLRALERSYLRAGSKKQALATLERLISADPVHAPEALRRAVELALASYRDTDALRFAERAVEVRPDDARAQRLLGDLHRGLRDLDAAQRAYARALSLAPRDYDTALVLAQVEIARGKREQAEQALLTVLSGSPDDELLTRAARALIQLDVSLAHLERVEPALLALALAHPERPLHRKLLIELYGSWLTPLAVRVTAQRATEPERALLVAIGRRAIKPLLEALLDPDPLQRGVVLGLLGAMGNENAVGPLLALAEQGADTAERARALTAVGLLADVRTGPRLQALAGRAEGRLRPIAVWALLRTLGAGARADLLHLAADGDAGVRVMASLGLGAIDAREAVDVLHRLLEERHASVRAAAVWALSRVAPDAARSRRALDWPAPAWQVAIATTDDAGVLTRALLSANPEQRLDTAERVRVGTRGPIERLPPPAWPFVPRRYLLQLVEVGSSNPSVRPTMPAGLAAAFPQAAREALEDPLRRGTMLRALTLNRGRLSLGGLEGLLACGERATLLGHLSVLRAPLAELTQTGSEEERALALTALARLGAEDSATFLPVLGAPASAARRALLDALGERGQSSAALRPVLEQLARSAPDWPTRRRARRALGPAAAKLPALQREPVALVRAVARPGPPRGDRCSDPAGATVN